MFLLRSAALATFVAVLALGPRDAASATSGSDSLKKAVAHFEFDVLRGRGKAPASCEALRRQQGHGVFVTSAGMILTLAHVVLPLRESFQTCNASAYLLRVDIWTGRSWSRLTSIRSDELLRRLFIRSSVLAGGDTALPLLPVPNIRPKDDLVLLDLRGLLDVAVPYIPLPGPVDAAQRAAGSLRDVGFQALISNRPVLLEDPIGIHVGVESVEPSTDDISQFSSVGVQAWCDSGHSGSPIVGLDSEKGPGYVWALIQAKPDVVGPSATFSVVFVHDVLDDLLTTRQFISSEHGYLALYLGILQGSLVATLGVAKDPAASAQLADFVSSQSWRRSIVERFPEAAERRVWEAEARLFISDTASGTLKASCPDVEYAAAAHLRALYEEGIDPLIPLGATLRALQRRVEADPDCDRNTFSVIGLLMRRINSLRPKANGPTQVTPSTGCVEIEKVLASCEPINSTLTALLKN